MLRFRTTARIRRALPRPLALVLALAFAFASYLPLVSPIVKAQTAHAGASNGHDSTAGAAAIETIANDTPQTATPLRFGSAADDDSDAGATLAAVQTEDATPHYAATNNQAIFPAGDEDYYSFVLADTSSLYAYVDAGTSGTSRDTVLTLYAADGATVIEEDDNDGASSGGGTGGDLASAIAGRTLAPGNYYLRVKAKNAADTISPYRLYVAAPTTITSESEPNNSTATANGLSDTARINGTISSSDTADYYSFSVAAGQRVYFSLDEDPDRDGATTDLIIFVRNSSGSILFAINSSSDATPAEGFNTVFQNAGTHYISIERGVSSGGIGDYNLLAAFIDDRSVQRRPEVVNEQELNNTPAQAMLLDDTRGGVTVRGSIGPVGDVDYFTFTVPASERIYAYVDTGDVEGASTGSSRDSVLTLFGADGTTVIEEDDDDGTGNGGNGSIESGGASAISRRLTDAGTYYLRVRAFSDSTISPYRLYVVVTDSPATSESTSPNDSAAQAEAISGDAPVRGSLASTTDSDFYKIEARGGNQLFVSLLSGDGDSTSGDLDLQARLIAPDGSTTLIVADSAPIPLSNPSVESFSFFASQTGAYFLEVRYGEGAPGAYLLLFKALSGGDLAQVIYPTADSFVRGADADRNTNFGTATEMQVKRTLNPGNGRGRRGFLTFDIRDINLTEAAYVKLRLRARLSDASLANVPMFVAYFRTSWTETGITWNNQPAAPGATFTNLGTLTVNDSAPRWYEFDMTQFIRAERAAGNTSIHLRLVNTVPTGTSGAFFTSVASREATGGFSPRLIVYR